MANETTATVLADFIQASIGEARTVGNAGADLSQFVTRRPLEVGKGSATFPYYDKQVMASVAEATDLSNTAFSTTDVTIVPGENGLMTTLTDLADRRSATQAGFDIGKVMGEAAFDLRTSSIYNLFDGFSTALGTTNVDITEALIQQAVATLRAKRAPGTLYLPVTPWVLEDLLGLYSSNTDHVASDIRDQAMKTGTLPPIHGVTPLMVILPDGTSAGQIDAADTKTAIFSAAALGFVEEWDFRIETGRDISLRAVEIVATTSFGVGEIRDDWGVELLVDNKD